MAVAEPEKNKYRYIIIYNGEFSTVIEIDKPDPAKALRKVRERPFDYQWECVASLCDEYFEHETSELTEDELEVLGF